MSRDQKLREVLDRLDDEPARSLPSQDRELLGSVLRRLKIQEGRRVAVRRERPTSELDSAREEARRNAEALEALRAQQAAEESDIERLREERAALLEHQRDLEERLARLEAASHGGPLSYVEEENDDEVVEFSRVDLPQQDEMLEFQYLGTEQAGFEEPRADAWDEETRDDATGRQWPGPDWSEEEQDSGSVQWDEEDTGAAGAQAPDDWPHDAQTPGDEDARPEPASWDEREPWPEQETWEETDDDTPEWRETGPRDEPPAPPREPMAAPDEPLDERTRAELDELETQLADLEREIERRGSKDRKAEADDDAA